MPPPLQAAPIVLLGVETGQVEAHIVCDVAFETVDACLERERCMSHAKTQGRRTHA
ncbi:hypothetical protein [Halomonas sp. E19]|uniref:hypothetical protein n=1 Tax=Halomonas sp. E19 TaxID=3397247 RepID=UPI00403488A1